MKLTNACLLLALAACSTPSYVGHVTSPPPRWTEPREQSSSRTSASSDEAADRFLSGEIERKTRVTPRERRYEVPRDTRQTYEPETKRFLETEIDRRTPPPEPEVRYVERTVYVDRPYARPYAYSYPEYRRSHDTFPWNTAWGAGIGAVIGNQHHHHAGRGALIGGGIGLLFDLARWH